MTVKRTERGWAGHFICAPHCMFRRNTLLEKDLERIVVSTVGNYRLNEILEPIGGNGRYYETMAFKAEKEGPYWEADVSKQLSFQSQWSICADYAEDLPEDVDNQADQMHERVVEEFTQQLSST